MQIHQIEIATTREKSFTSHKLIFEKHLSHFQIRCVLHEKDVVVFYETEAQFLPSCLFDKRADINYKDA